MSIASKDPSWRKTIAAGLIELAVILAALSVLLVVTSFLQASTENTAWWLMARYRLRLDSRRILDMASRYDANSPARAEQQAEMRRLHDDLQTVLSSLKREDTLLAGSGAVLPEGLIADLSQRSSALRQHLETLFATTAPDKVASQRTAVIGEARDLLSFLSEQSGAERDGTMRAQETRFIQMVLGLLVLVVAGLMLWMAWRIASRARILRTTVERISGGELELRAEVEGHDELASIAASFNDMTERVRDMLEKEGRFFTLSSHLLCSMGYDGQLKRFNRAWSQMLERTDAELLSTPFLDFVHPEDREATSAAIQQLIGSGDEVMSLENRCLARDGAEHWLSWNLKPVPADSVIYCIAMEITQRRRAESDREELIGTIHQGTLRLATATGGVVGSTNQQALGAQEQAAAIAETMAAVEEVEQTTRQAAARAAAVAESSQLALDNGKAGRKAVEDTISAMGRVRQQVESIADTILTLAEQAQNIGEIVSSVDHIADQTNLLALNAAIEAARAGEQGKGFTVVANEIRLLADQSKRATVQVRQLLGEIQKLTHRSVLSMEEGTKSVGEAMSVVSRADDTIRALVETINLAAASASQILASSNQQSVGVKQIHQAMKNIQQVTNSSLSATQKAQSSVQDLNALAESLKSLVAADGRARAVK